jgi:hypothetical protein
MGLIGSKIEMMVEHPKEFARLLYEEIFDHHPEDVEVDVIVQIYGWPNEDGVNADGLDVVDYAVIRVGDEVFLDGYNGESPGDPKELIAYAKAVDSRAREMLGGADPIPNGYFFVHKHPEGVEVEGSDKDELLNAMLTTVDMARGMKRTEFHGEPVFPRAFQMFATMHRDESMPQKPRGPVPVLDREIDLVILGRFREMAQEKYGIEPDHEYYTLLDEFEEASIAHFDALDEGDEAAIEAAEVEVRRVALELAIVTTELQSRELLKGMPEPLRNAVEKMLDEIRATDGSDITELEIKTLDADGNLHDGFHSAEAMGFGSPEQRRQNSDELFPPLDANLGPDVARPAPQPSEAPPEDGTARPAVPDVFDIEWLT